MKFKLITIALILIVSSAIGCNKKAEKSNSFQSESVVLTAETQNLLKSLKSIPEKGFMIGHQDDPMYGIGWNGDANRSDIKSITGDYPAVMGFDLGRVELGNADNLDKVNFDKIRQEVIKQYNRGGMITFSWHINNPMTDGDSWNNTPGAVKTLLPDSINHEKFIQWLQHGVDYLKTLKTADGTKIPILFRPWHEHTGSWFWWGQDNCTAEEYKQLWIMTHDFFKEQGMDNLIWAYSPGAVNTTEEYMERYPGDEYVDLLGFDTYHFNNQKGTEDFTKIMNNMLTIITQLGKEKNKPIAVTETGIESLPIADWWTNVLFPVIDKYPISYVLVWRNAHDIANHFYAPYPGQLSATDFVKFYQNPKTLFNKDIQNLYK
ncbi:MAG TPA: glycosyl hydrolase [Paludibacter sp.]|nr:MAG: Mannan endo-1,4-beta-mannosidase precursor [Bacteroidetes bacterium ADurb.Bin174]HQB27556.1 glycosyl hydrolase [Paludibacter sp.]